MYSQKVSYSAPCWILLPLIFAHIHERSKQYLIIKKIKCLINPCTQITEASLSVCPPFSVDFFGYGALSWRKKENIFLLLLFEVFKSVKYEKSSHMTNPRINKNKNSNFTEVCLMQNFTFILWRFSELNALKVHRSGLKWIRAMKNNWKITLCSVKNRK